LLDANRYWGGFDGMVDIEVNVSQWDSGRYDETRLLYIDGWFDWSHDGDYDDTGVVSPGTPNQGQPWSEHVVSFSTDPSTWGQNSMTFSPIFIIGEGPNGAIYTRWRVSYNEAPNDSFGPKDYGEVEDYGPVADKDQGKPPPAISISTFTGASEGDCVLLNWQTETELDNVGFAVYRNDTKDGKYAKIGFVPAAEDSETSNDYQFTDKEVEQGQTYFYYLEDVDLKGEKSKSEIIKVVMPPAKSEVIKVVVPPANLVIPIPSKFALLQNYPNPFNPDTWLPYQLAHDANVIIRIYDVKGRVIRTLDLGQREAGYYLNKGKAAYWDGKDTTGQSVSSGVYFYSFKAGDFSTVRKMVIIK